MIKIYKNGETVILDRLFLHNNLWGEKNGNGSQWISVESNISHSKTSNIPWQTGWEWDGPENSKSIKSFASIVYGWHWGWKIKDPNLPMAIRKIKKIDTRWKFNLPETNTGTWNVTYDIWLSRKSAKDQIIADENPDGEVMIWLNQAGEVPPIGKKIKEVIINNTLWELWIGPHPESGWPVFSFIRKENTDEFDGDIKPFLDEAENHKAAKKQAGKNQNPDFVFLLGIQAGIEVLYGTGELFTSEYSVELY